MINLKNNKGITLAAEVITVLVLAMIVSVITYSSMSSVQVKNLNKMYTDIVTIQGRAITYYMKYGKAPIDDTAQIPRTKIIGTGTDDFEIPEAQLNPNDDHNGYYKIDTKKLINLTLNYKMTDDNYYFINTKTLSVYYSKGIKINNILDRAVDPDNEVTYSYHTVPENYDGVTNVAPIITKIQTEI